VASGWAAGKGFLTSDRQSMQPARDPILTRSRAAAAREGNGRGLQPVAVKEELAELPVPVDNGEVASS
jgi:hypothetical protein